MNLQPLINLIGNTGEITTEYAAFKSATLFGKVTMVVGILIAAAGFIATSLPGSKAATYAGMAVTGLGLVGTFLSSIHYTAGRQNAKANAASILRALAATEIGAAAMLAPIPPTSIVATVAKAAQA